MQQTFLDTSATHVAPARPCRVSWRVLEANYNNSSTRIKTYETDRIDMREHVREAPSLALHLLHWLRCTTAAAPSAQVIDFGKQDVITKDTVLIKIDALVYFRITDARAAVYRVQNLPDAIELLTQATLRDIVAQMTLDDTFSSREQINAVLLSKVQRDAERWGVTITRVEIFNILPPADIGEAMQQQIRAERERRSAVLRADGQRESKAIESRGYAAKLVLQAEGEKSSAVLVAKGHAEAKKVIAQAEAQALALMREAVAPFNMRGVDYATAVEYLRTLAQLGSARDGGNTTVTLLPVDTVDGLEKLTGGTGGPVRFG